MIKILEFVNKNFILYYSTYKNNFYMLNKTYFSIIILIYCMNIFLIHFLTTSLIFLIKIFYFTKQVI